MHSVLIVASAVNRANCTATKATTPTTVTTIASPSTLLSCAVAISSAQIPGP